MVIYRVQKVFQLQDRLVLVSDAPSVLPGFTHGGTVKLKRPDGSVLTSKAWLETSWPPSDDRPVSFSIESKFQKADIPEGTEIWIDKESTKDTDDHRRTA